MVRPEQDTAMSNARRVGGTSSSDNACVHGRRGPAGQEPHAPMAGVRQRRSLNLVPSFWRQADASMIGQLGVGFQRRIGGSWRLAEEFRTFSTSSTCTAHTSKSGTFFYVVLASGSHLPVYLFMQKSTAFVLEYFRTFFM